MPPHSNFTFRDPHEPEAALIGVASVLKALVEETEVQLDRSRVRQFVDEACAGDMPSIARAMWFASWILGEFDADGVSRKE